MKNQIFLIVFFFLCSNIGLGQNKEIDTTRILNKIKETEAIEFSEPIKALKKYEEIYNLSTSIDFDKGAFKAVLYSAYLHNNLAQYDSAFFFFDKAKTINLRLKEPLNDAYIALNRANTYMYQGDLESSIENHFYGIEILEKEKDSARLIGAYANLSTVFDQLDDFDKEIEYLKKSLNLTPKDGWQDMALTYGDIGLAYIDKKNYEKAYVNLSKADSISQLTKSSMLDFYVTRNWGDYYISIEDFKTAIGYLKTSILKAKENNYKFYEKELMINLGECYVKIGNLELAEPILMDALNEGKELAVLEIPKKASILLSKLYEKKKNYKNANLYLNQHLLFKDSLVSQEHIKTVNNLDLKYQTEKKDKELAEQKLIIQESKSKNQTMNILIVSLLLGSILLWFSFRQRQKRMQQQLVAIEREQEVRTLESLIEGEEKERFRIAKELHDGVNGDLAAIKFKLTSLLETNNQVINEAVTMIDNSCEQVRAISHNLVPPSLKDFDLLEAVEEYCQSMNSIHEPSIEFQQLGDPIDLDKKQEANVFRIVQELVTNSIKHAEAKEINVQLSHLNNTLQLTVEDNGKGFDPKTVKSDGIGMQNVQSRVDYLNATMDFLSNEKGTSYTIAMDTKTSTS
ncbi:ATP-binding protein [Maribacter sp. 2308TA10-17]|uniref:tetratricopeptide repeat-containing sensor histidine kinase n=1 Tax=Maribacter sp. 2308TA10-17 TaxID=3386276 RepID=UPI0039BD9231